VSDIREEAVSRAGRVLFPANGFVFSDYLALMKPRVMSLVVFTALVGMAAAPGDMSLSTSLISLVLIAIGAGASGALNMWYDADIDIKMQRTATRPIPRGQVQAHEALYLGAVLSVFSVIALGFAANWTAAALLALTIGFYVFIYTMWLKRRTPQNIVIGGAAGAFPPMVGWAAMTGTVDLGGIVLFLIIFLWTPPHFWALSLYRTGDYQRAGIPMLPVVAGKDHTRFQILLYSLLLIPVTLLPLATGMAGMLYAAVAAVLGALFLVGAATVFIRRTGNAAEKAARGLFRYSILYLFALFSVLLLEAIK